MSRFPFFSDKKALDSFCDRNNIAFIGLFGSHARGTATPTSDVDLLVQFTQPVDFFELIEAEQQLEQKLARPVDLVTVDSISSRIYPYIEKDLITLYERA